MISVQQCIKSRVVCWCQITPRVGATLLRQDAKGRLHEKYIASLKIKIFITTCTWKVFDLTSVWKEILLTQVQVPDIFTKKQFEGQGHSNSSQSSTLSKVALKGSDFVYFNIYSPSRPTYYYYMLIMLFLLFKIVYQYLQLLYAFRV